jgi:hypothetical protein
MITISPEDWADLVRRVEDVEAAAGIQKPSVPTDADLRTAYAAFPLGSGLRAVYNLGREHGKAGL